MRVYLFTIDLCSVCLVNKLAVMVYERLQTGGKMRGEDRSQYYSETDELQLKWNFFQVLVYKNIKSFIGIPTFVFQMLHDIHVMFSCFRPENKPVFKFFPWTWVLRVILGEVPIYIPHKSCVECNSSAKQTRWTGSKLGPVDTKITLRLNYIRSDWNATYCSSTFLK